QTYKQESLFVFLLIRSAAPQQTMPVGNHQLRVVPRRQAATGIGAADMRAERTIETLGIVDPEIQVGIRAHAALAVRMLAGRLRPVGIAGVPFGGVLRRR